MAFTWRSVAQGQTRAKKIHFNEVQQAVDQLVDGLGLSEVAIAMRDDFNRGDGDLGPGWANWMVNDGVGQIENKKFKQTNAGTTQTAWVVDNGQTFNNNQEVEVTLSTLPSENPGYIYLIVRAEPGGDGYLAILARTASWAVYLYRLDNGANVYVGTFLSGGTINAGDRIGLRVFGSTFTFLLNGVATGITINEATYTSGVPGFGGAYSNTYRIDNFVARGVTNWKEIPVTENDKIQFKDVQELRDGLDFVYDNNFCVSHNVTHDSANNNNVESGNNVSDHTAHNNGVETGNNATDHSSHNTNVETLNNAADHTSHNTNVETGDNASDHSVHNNNVETLNNATDHSSHNNNVESGNNATDHTTHNNNVDTVNQAADHTTHNNGVETGNNATDHSTHNNGVETGNNAADHSNHQNAVETGNNATNWSNHNTNVETGNNATDHTSHNVNVETGNNATNWSNHNTNVETGNNGSNHQNYNNNTDTGHNSSKNNTIGA